MRIQIFEAKSVKALLQAPIVDRYNAAPPIYLVFPDNSPYLIHSAFSSHNPYYKGLSQVISNLFSRPSKPVEVRPNDIAPTKSLTSLSILKGAGRSANAQGAWDVYARAEADEHNNPLAAVAHPSTAIAQNRKRRQESDITRDVRDSKRPLPTHTLNKLVNLRFHGDIDRDYSSTPVVFSSATFTIKSSFGTLKNNQFRPTLTMKLQGSDVFGGIKDLALEGAVDLECMPGWITGENGVSEGKIVDGKFIHDQ